MKKVSVMFVVAMAAVFFVSSCGKEEGGSTTQSGSGTMTADVDGSSWAATKFEGTLLRDKDNGVERLDLRGTGSDDKMIVLTLQENSLNDCVTIGDYSFDDGDALFTYLTVTTGGGTLTEHIVMDGEMNISKCNGNKVSGTFEFNSLNVSTGDTLKVTNGVFTDFSYKIMN